MIHYAGPPRGCRLLTQWILCTWLFPNWKEQHHQQDYSNNNNIIIIDLLKLVMMIVGSSSRPVDPPHGGESKLKRVTTDNNISAIVA